VQFSAQRNSEKYLRPTIAVTKFFGSALNHDGYRQTEMFRGLAGAGREWRLTYRKAPKTIVFWLHDGATSGKQEFMNDFLPLDTLEIPKDVINDLTTGGGQWDAIDIHDDVFQLFYLGIKP